MWTTKTASTVIRIDGSQTILCDELKMFGQQVKTHYKLLLLQHKQKNRFALHEKL